MAGFRTTGTRNVADVGFTRLDEVTIEAPDGSTAIRFVLRMHRAVAVVPLDGDDVVLIEQYRTPFGRPLLEIPAGLLDVPGEDPERAVRRELEEGGLVLSGISPDDRLVEIIELPGHPFFIGSQFHPEFKSRPDDPHPLFYGFVKAALQQRVMAEAEASVTSSEAVAAGS